MAMDAITNLFNIGKAEGALDQILYIDLDLLDTNPFQPRKSFDEIQMEELSRSIAELGVIQPIVVRQVEDHFQIVAGERRWRAAKKAGLSTIPSIIRQFSDREMAEIALVENLQRADLGYFEVAEGYRKLIEDFHLTQEEVATRVGKSQPTVANKLRILKIDPEVKELIMVDLLTERHVRALLRLQKPSDQVLILKEIYERDLNVKDTEELITDYLEGRAIIIGDEESPGEEEDNGEPRRQTIRRVFSDTRIHINTIKAAIAQIIESGVDVTIDQTETDDHVRLTITIPRIKR
ncbi:MAG: ParB/RepB/Spo0J family partition protein [Clostridiales bacterium]|nr:ParB/RepB/Spo0J family partition protein [Clostridiales bacterium]